ncbi:MAG: hypothetical protein ACFFCD_11405 [Promethearchaeota archaeon]
MKITTRNLLISCLGAFIVCLIASAATPVVFAEESIVEEEEPYWGNLKVGDKMRWYLRESYHNAPTEWYDELEILEIQGESLKVEYNHTSAYSYGEIVIIKLEKATWASDELWPFIYPAALLQENEDVIVKTYKRSRFGITYIAAYLKTGGSEYWWDYNTGILFAYTPPSSYMQETQTLVYTNAKLTTPEMRYLPLFLKEFLNEYWITLVVSVALVSIVIVVLYRRTRYQKKKHT